jgi:uncharacterized protein (TIGR03437 family)
MPTLAPGSIGSILGDPAQSPLSSLTRYASPKSNGALPYELAGVSVTIGGKVAPLISVSPARIDFYVPAGVAVGQAEVIVTSLDGHVSRGTTNINRIAPAIFTRNGTGTGAGMILNSATRQADTFSISTPYNLSLDKRTRLMIFATGISNGAANTNLSNDVTISEGVVLENLAESVAVQARTSSGQTFQLAVEYAGAQGFCAGLDQINVILPPGLSGAGSVELTITVGTKRSNIVTVMIQ